MISDVLDTEENILERNELKDHYKLDSVNFLDYLRLSRAVKGFIKCIKLVLMKKYLDLLCPIVFGYQSLKVLEAFTMYHLIYSKIIIQQKLNGKKPHHNN